MSKYNSKISVLLLTQNSAGTLRRTLESIKDFDEIVVIDGGSSDNTESIVESYSNAKFIFNGWPGFVTQRNFSIEQARNEWCFMIDSDEACTPELADALHQIVEKEDALPLYRVMRTEFFLGRAIEIGHGKSDYQDRLFKKSRVRYGGGNHHEHYIDGEYAGSDHPLVGNIDSKLRVLHDQDYDFEQWLKKIPRFSVLIGNEKMHKGRKTSACGVIFDFGFNFFKIYFKSWRAGRLGFVIAASTAVHRCLVKLYMYQHQYFVKNKKNDFEKKVLG